MTTSQSFVAEVRLWYTSVDFVHLWMILKHSCRIVEKVVALKLSEMALQTLLASLRRE